MDKQNSTINEQPSIAVGHLSSRLEGLFRRRTTSLEWMAELDGLRFVAISSVFLAHTYHCTLGSATPHPCGLLHFFMHTAGRGVELFFVVSGFILGLPLARHFLCGAPPVDTARYFWRRLTRLEPPYIIVMVGFFLAQAIPVHSSFTSDLDTTSLLKSLGASLLYCHWILIGQRPHLNGVAWSLEVEVQFYILAPIIAALVFSVSNSFLRRLVFGALIVAAPWVQQLYEVSPNTILGQIQYFLLGLLLVDIFLSDVRVQVDPIKNCVLAGFLLVCVFGIPVRESSPIHLNLFCAFLLVLFLLAMSPGPLRDALRFRPISITGGMCYSIYLLHYPIVVIVGRATRGLAENSGIAPAFLINALAGGLVTLICAGMFFLLIEKPCMDPQWPQKFHARAISFLKDSIGRT